MRAPSASRSIACALYSCILCTASGCATFREWTGRAEGQIVGRVAAVDGTAIGRAVVFLDPVDAPRRLDALPPLLIRMLGGQFDPSFAVAVIDQKVVFANRDKTFHGVFSYSRSNEFARKPFGPGESRSVTFQGTGVVQTYSPLYEAMRGSILVVPDPHYALPDARGDFRISRVPPGRYRASLWSESRPLIVREISLSAGQLQHADFSLGPVAPAGSGRH